MMQEINPSVKESILNTAEHLNEASAIYKKGIEEGIQRVRTAKGIHIGTLIHEPAPKHYCLKSYIRSASTQLKLKIYAGRWKDNREKFSPQGIGV